jgi:ketosteroid isomerase-like protein
MKLAICTLLLGILAAPAAASPASVPDHIVAMERAALDRWGNGDPSGFLEIFAPDVVYFDSAQKKRVDGLAAMTALYESIRGKVHFERYELIDPKVQVIGDAAVLTFNFVSWDEKGEPNRWNTTEVYRRDPAGWRIIQSNWSMTEVMKP